MATAGAMQGEAAGRELRELAVPGTHARLVRHIVEVRPPKGADGVAARVLDLGAGPGAMSARLRGLGYAVSACDMFPEMFAAEGIECRKVDAEKPLPYGDGEFDLVIALEVVEHLESHRVLFTEVSRILRPGGVFVFSTPNIMSLKSRVKFLLTGYFYSHGPLDPAVHSPVTQHIAAFTPDRYRFVLGRCGLRLREVRTDKPGNSSRVLGALCGLWPMVKLATWRKYGDGEGARLNNCGAALFGRSMLGVAVKG